MRVALPRGRRGFLEGTRVLAEVSPASIVQRIYTSKCYPSEHRLAAKSSARCGMTLDSPETAWRKVERTRTHTGLSVSARIVAQVYEIGRKCYHARHDIKDRLARHDHVLGQWNRVIDTIASAC